jgi:hypothetical protein
MELELITTVQKLRDLGYTVDQHSYCISIDVFENTLLVNCYDTYGYPSIFSNDQEISYSKWIHDHHNILNGRNVIHTFDELLVAISRTTLMGG